MDQELFKAIFKLEGDNTSLLASLTEVNSKFKEQNDELKKQQIHLKTLTDREAALIKGRAEAQNPTQIVKYNKLLTENKTKIDEVKKSMENLTVTEQKNAKVTEDLGKKIAIAFDATKINAAKTEVEKLNKAFAETEKPVTSLRSQLRLLKEQIANTDDDKEFLKLSIEAGKLEDKINDARQAAQIFATDSPFQAVGNGIRGVAGDLLSLDFNGAAQKSKLLVEASKQINFKNSATAVKELGTTLFNVGRALLTNPIFLLGAVIVGIISNFDALKASGGIIGKTFTFLSETVTGLVKVFTDLTDAIGLTDIAATKALTNSMTAFNRMQEILIGSVNNRYGAEIALARAAGKEVVDLEIEKRQAIIDTYQAAINAQFAAVDGSEKSIRRATEFERTTKQLMATVNREIEILRAENNKKESDAEKVRSQERIKQMEDFLKGKAELEEYYANRSAQVDFEIHEKEIADQIKLAEDFKKKNEEFDKDEDKTRREENEKLKQHLKEQRELEAEHQLELDKLRKKQFLDQVSQIETITNATLNAATQILSVEAQKYEKLSSLQEKRVDDAKNIADKGNAELLELEQKRLDDLNQQREQYVRRQQALAVVELIANTAIAISKAAAQTGAFAVVGISAALIALAGGLAQARSMASQAAFYDGGFTGEGDPTQVSSNLGKKPYTYHKGEFVFNHEKTGRYKDIFQGIHTGNIDLNDWKNKVQAFESMKLFPQQREIDIAGLEKRMDRVITAIDSQSSSVNIDENGWMIRLKSIQTRNDFIKRHLARG